MKVQEGKIYLTEIPHEGRKLTFQYPALRGTFGNIARQIDAEGLQRPTSSQTASLVYDVLKNSKGKYESEILEILKSSWLVEFTGNRYLLKRQGEEVHNGVIIETNPKIVNGRLVMNRKSLIERLRKNDSHVKFVPFGFKVGEQSANELRKNSYILARYGEEGAEKIAELASKCERNPYLWTSDSVDPEGVTMSVLGGNWIFDGSLYVKGDWSCGMGHAFGVKASLKNNLSR